MGCNAGCACVRWVTLVWCLCAPLPCSPAASLGMCEPPRGYGVLDPSASRLSDAGLFQWTSNRSGTRRVVAGCTMLVFFCFCAIAHRQCSHAHCGLPGMCCFVRSLHEQRPSSSSAHCPLCSGMQPKLSRKHLGWHHPAASSTSAAPPAHMATQGRWVAHKASAQFWPGPCGNQARSIVT